MNKHRGTPPPEGGALVEIPIRVSPKTLELAKGLAKGVNMTLDAFIERLFVDAIDDCVSKVLKTSNELRGGKSGN